MTPPTPPGRHINYMSGQGSARHINVGQEGREDGMVGGRGSGGVGDRPLYSTNILKTLCPKLPADVSILGREGFAWYPGAREICGAP